MNRSGLCQALLALLLATAIPACSAQKTVSQKPPGQQSYASTLSREIHHQLLILPFYSVFDSITFTMEGGKVTLSGQVLRHTLKDHAEAAVKSLEGVSSVENQIEVLPVSPADDDLRRAVYRSLYEDSTLARYAVQAVPSVHIIVKTGTVSLSGSVDSDPDRNLAALRAGSVPNVVRVNNNLVVRPKGSAAE